MFYIVESIIDPYTLSSVTVSDQYKYKTIPSFDFQRTTDHAF